MFSRTVATQLITATLLLSTARQMQAGLIGDGREKSLIDPAPPPRRPIHHRNPHAILGPVGYIGIEKRGKGVCFCAVLFSCMMVQDCPQHSHSA